MIRPDQIPPESVKAAWQAMMAPDALAMHRAIAAAINAWQGIQGAWYEGDAPTAYIIPLPQKGEA